jgi:hypothetical protein
LGGVQTREPGFVRFSGIGTLFNLYHFDLLQNLETVPSASQKNNVPGTQLPAFEIVAILIVKIDAKPPPADKKHLLSVMDLPWDGIVDMRFDQFAPGMVHIGQLLRKFGRGEKVDVVLHKCRTHDDPIGDIVKADEVQRIFFHSYAPRALLFILKSRIFISRLIEEYVVRAILRDLKRITLPHIFSNKLTVLSFLP